MNYSYRVSLAVALSSRPLARIGRIWADGNLIRGASGEFKIDVQMRVHAGHENQRLDPLLASAEILGECPAHRGIAYVVFEDLQLAEFGNRIPSFTFEIFEQDGPVQLSSLLASVSEGEIKGESAIEITGFAAAGASVRDALSPILDVCPVELLVRNSALFVRDIAASHDDPVQIGIAADENARPFDRPKHVMLPAGNIPGAVSLRYYDADRDYQAGLQHSDVNAGGRGEMRLELPAVLAASTAKRLVEAKDKDVRYARAYWTGSVTTSGKPYQPGDHIITPDGQQWQIVEVEMALGTVAIRAKAAAKYRSQNNIIGNRFFGVSGRHVASVDQLIGETRIIIIEVPLLAGGDPNQPALAIFAAGTKAGWKRAALSYKVDDQWFEIGSTAPSATMGFTLNSLAPHPTYLLDEASALEIETLHEAMELPIRDTSPFAIDTPIFWIGGEFVRVGRVQALGPQQYRLSRFCRGCFSSSLEASARSDGATVVLMEPSSALPLSEATVVLGQIVEVEAQGLSDVAPVATSCIVEGLAVKPLAPVHGRSVRNFDGSLNLEWKRRSRLDLGWVDGVDQVQIEDHESYRVALYVNDVVLREWTVAASAIHISAAECAAAGIPRQATAVFSVRQIGRFAQSDPLTFSIS